MRFIGLFTDITINQALAVLGFYASMLAEKLGGEWKQQRARGGTMTWPPSPLQTYVDALRAALLR